MQNNTPQAKASGIFSAFGKLTILRPRNKFRGIMNGENKRNEHCLRYCL